MSNMLDWALLYASQGLSVIPVRGKTPLVLWKEFQERRATEDEIRNWWAQFPDADVALVTGPISNRFVLDSDGPIGQLNIDTRKIRPTACVRTRRGRQYHFNFPVAFSAKTTVAAVFEEIDTRGVGGIVLLPPSLCSDGTRYEWIGDMNTPLAEPPQWLLDKLSEKPNLENTSGLSSTKEPWLEELLQGVGDGLRHQSLIKLGGYYFNHFPPEVALIHLREWNKKNSPPIDDFEFEEQLTDLKNRFANGEYKANYVEEKETDLINLNLDVDKYLNEIQQRTQHVKPEFSTGFAALDKITRGFPRQNLYVIGAPTNGGKTQFVLSSIHSLLQQGKRVLYFSTEMPQNEIVDRFNAIGAKIPLDELRSGFLKSENKQRLIKFLQTHDSSNFIISPEDTPTIDSIRLAVQKSQPDIIFLDHIHHIKMKTDNRRTEIDDFVLNLKKLILEKNLPCVITAQLRRKEAIEGSIAYTMHDFKESGGIENEAGVCLLLCPPDEWTTEQVQHVTAYIPKNRHGRREVRFNLDFDTKIPEFRETGHML